MPPAEGAGDRLGSAVARITDIKIDIQALTLRRDMALNLLSRDRFEENCIYLFFKLGWSWRRIARKVDGRPDTSEAIRKACERYQW